jgi:hypothetical protein
LETTRLSVNYRSASFLFFICSPRENKSEKSYLGRGYIHHVVRKPNVETGEKKKTCRVTAPDNCVERRPRTGQAEHGNLERKKKKEEKKRLGAPSRLSFQRK